MFGDDKVKELNAKQCNLFLFCCKKQFNFHSIRNFVFINHQNMNYFLVKSEPATYAWQQFVKDGKTMWEGVRNFAARKNLRSMKMGDLVLFYHSGEDKAVMGIAKVSKEFYQDTTTKEDWSVVDLVPVKPFKKAVTLSEIKKEKMLQDIYLVRQGRLSVMPLEKKEFELIVKMGS